MSKKSKIYFKTEILSGLMPTKIRKFLKFFTDLSLSEVSNATRIGAVTINGKTASTGTILKAGDILQILEIKSPDQFFTKPEIVDRVLANIDFSDYKIIVEPAAGSGEFFAKLPKGKRVAIDLDPLAQGIKKQDFFHFSLSLKILEDVEEIKNMKILTIGNPPYGSNCSLARKFFDCASEYSDTIAFILPRTFRKPSVANYLNRSFHLTHEEILPLDSFYTPYLENYEVPTVFQIWKKRDTIRELMPILLTCEDFEFTDQERGEFSIQRVGGKAGTVFDDCDRNWKSHYFIKPKNKLNVIKDIFKSIEWKKDGPKYDTAGNPSISKNDLIKGYLEKRDQ